METIASELEVDGPHLETNSERPKRILVRTKTHLVPDDDYGARCYFMLNRICQHHWSRDFLFGEDRWNSYGTQFGYDNRTCYFLVDHGRSASDDDVSVLWYEWTPRPKRGLPDADTMHRIIRSNLRLDIKLLDADFAFMSKPENVEWLGDNVENKFWLNFVLLAKSRKGEGASIRHRHLIKDCDTDGGNGYGTRAIPTPTMQIIASRGLASQVQTLALREMQRR
ncbi:hypothetical protein O1611_g10220 [Lasiodiplodia mahajangana]|uniref:Uncharacterized protein n=1 Tax=Lasiodiplodia mahajangana TaxID=1108764 RepID=A0ACC2J0J6_9PEZI|nr:hypothetical protein O1611_g10220 [Lasiodiplodia mahajangana]